MTFRIRSACLAGLLATLAAIAGCSSTPTVYYTLLAPAPAGAPPPAPAYRIEVLDVAVPAQVDRPEFVVRTGAGELAPVDSRQWIAPLSGEIRTALSNELTQRLGAHDVYGLPHDGALPTYRVRLSVQRFDSALGVNARIDAGWTLERAGEGSTVTAGPACGSSVSETVAPGYAALAEGQQRALAEIAGRIASSIRTAAATGAAPACPAGQGASE